MKYTKIRKKIRSSEISISVYLSYKKKRRGLSRLIKHINLWKEKHINLNLDNLDANKKQFVKFNFSSFYDLIKSQNPPLWYQSLLLKALYDIYKSWFVELSKLSKPFYLKIWLMKNDFMSSQIVVGIDEDIGIYPSIFDESPINPKSSINKLLESFPFLENMFIIPLFHLTSLNTEKDTLSKKEIKKLNKINVRTNNEPDGSISFVYPLDTVFLCSL